MPAPLRGLWAAITGWLREQSDLLPPYHIYQGSDWERRAVGDRFYLVVGTDEVEIDGVTFRLLESGETIKVRYTRRFKAINLDRFTGALPPDQRCDSSD